MIKKKIIRKRTQTEEVVPSTSPTDSKHHLATKSVQAWYKDHADTSVYSKKFNHKLEKINHQEDL